jgi:cell division protein FtsN
MFYIIATRIPLVLSDTSNRKYLKIFVLGSLLYICIHYYLHLEARAGVLEHIKDKLLIIMALDFLAACGIAKFLQPVVEKPVESEDETEKEKSGKPNNAINDKERIMKELEERRRFEMQRMQQAQMLQAQQAAQAQQVSQLQSQQAAFKQAQVQNEEKTKTKSKSKSKKKDTTTSSSSESSSSSSSSSSSESSEKKPAKKQTKSKKEEKKEKVEKVESEKKASDTDTDMPVYKN